MAKVKSATQKRKATAKKAVTKANPPKVSGEELRAKQMIKKYADKAAKKLEPVKSTKKVYKPDAKTLKFAVMLSVLNIYKVNLGFLRFSRPDFFEFIANVFYMLLDNSSYPTPEPTIAAIQAEIVLYQQKKAAKNTTGANQHLANIKYMMKQLAIYVANTCNNDIEIFNTSGFIANKLKPGPVKNIGQAKITDVKETLKSGEAIAIVDKVPGANFYKGSWRLASDPLGPLNYTRGGAGIKVKFVGLPIDADVLLYVTASGPLEDGDPSKPYPYSPR